MAERMLELIGDREFLAVRDAVERLRESDRLLIRIDDRENRGLEREAPPSIARVRTDREDDHSAGHIGVP